MTLGLRLSAKNGPQSMFSRITAARTQSNAMNNSVRRGKDNNNSSRIESNPGSYRKVSNDGASSKASNSRRIANSNNDNVYATGNTAISSERPMSASTRTKAGMGGENSDKGASLPSGKNKSTASPSRTSRDTVGGGKGDDGLPPSISQSVDQNSTRTSERRAGGGDTSYQYFLSMFMFIHIIHIMHIIHCTSIIYLHIQHPTHSCHTVATPPINLYHSSLFSTLLSHILSILSNQIHRRSYW